MPSLATILVLWGVLAPLAAYGFAKADAFFERRAAVADARMVEQRACAVKIAQVELAVNEAADKRIEEAHDAASKVAPAPVDAGALGRLCKSDGRSCRSVGQVR